jgi:hypothetical protein
VNGNDWTGRVHIDKRHSLTSRLPYWDKNQKIGNPTKFGLQIAPVHYIDLADKIYCPENLCNEKNNRPELFDIYIGEVKFLRLPEYEYTLVLYKNTKILHTLFLSSNSRPFNKKKVLNWRQGWTSFTHNLATGIETYKIPYFDHNDNERAEIILRCIKSIGKEIWYVQINQEDGSPQFTSIVKEENCINSISPQIRSVQLDFSDMNWLEKEIKKLMNNEKNGSPNKLPPATARLHRVVKNGC